MGRWGETEYILSADYPEFGIHGNVLRMMAGIELANTLNPLSGEKAPGTQKALAAEFQLDEEEHPEGAQVPDKPGQIAQRQGEDPQEDDVKDHEEPGVPAAPENAF